MLQKLMSCQDFFRSAMKMVLVTSSLNSFQVQIYTRKFRLFSAVCEFQTDKGRYINSDISKQSFAIEGSLTKSNLVSLSKATRRVLSDLYSERLFCIRSLLKNIGLPESYTIERCDILQRSSAEEFCIPWSTFSSTIDKSCWLNRGIIARPVLNTGHRSDLTWKQKVKKVEQLAGCSRRK